MTKEWRVILYTHKQRVNANQNHDWATKHEQKIKCGGKVLEEELST